MILNFTNFEKTLKKNYCFEVRPEFAVAVSGGPDSMCLLYLLNQWSKIHKANVIALIVNHNLRFDSKSESKNVYKFINDLNIKVKILNVKKSKISKKNMNEARNNRYNLLTNFCYKNNILHLFVAHHLDDNLETFLNRKISGSDFEGLISMQYISQKNKVNILRPLLYFSKEQIIQFNSKNNINYVTDPSNSNLNYTRPIIRKFLNETSKKNYNQIKGEFNIIKNNFSKYKMMISEVLNKYIYDISETNVKIKYEVFLELNLVISEIIVKKIYGFFNSEDFHLRSKKIQIFLDKVREKQFKVFNLRGMLIKKIDKTLIFAKKTN